MRSAFINHFRKAEYVKSGKVFASSSMIFLWLKEAQIFVNVWKMSQNMKALISCRDFMLRKIFQYFLMDSQNFIKSWISKNFPRHILIHKVQNIWPIQNKKYIINYLMNSFDDASGNLVVQVPGYLLKLLLIFWE